MAQDVKFVKKLGYIRKYRRSFATSQECGEWPNLFATIVANTELQLDIAASKALCEEIYLKIT